MLDHTPKTYGSQADKARPTRAPKKRKAILFPLLAFLGAASVVSMLVTILLQNEATRATDVRGDALRSRETGHVLQTRLMHTFSTLADLPCQSASFISSLDHVLLVVDGVVRKYSIENYAMHNASSLVLYTTLRTGHTAPHSIVITDRSDCPPNAPHPAPVPPCQASACKWHASTTLYAPNPASEVILSLQVN